MEALRCLRLCESFWLVWLVVSGAWCKASIADERPPNVVVFLVDDLGATDLGCYGSTFYETPHIDRLAARGMRFTTAYSTCPVCSPTRASMMTGRYPQRTGITDYINASGANQPEKWNRNTRLLPAAVFGSISRSRSGRLPKRCATRATRRSSAGKWHLGGEGFLPTDQGFDVNKGGGNWGSPKTYFSPYGNPQLSGWSARRVADAAAGRRGVPVHRGESRSAVLRVLVVLLGPHSAAGAGEAGREIRGEGGRPQARRARGWARKASSKVRLVQDHPTYAAMIEEMDNAVGMVLDKLDELGLTENTIVLFTADNGGLATAEGSPTSNLPLRAGKGWMYEGGIRVPTIVRWPAVVKAGSTCDDADQQLRLFSDVFGSRGAAVSDEQSGRAENRWRELVAAARGETASGQLAERALYWDYPHYGNQGGTGVGGSRG